MKKIRIISYRFIIKISITVSLKIEKSDLYSKNIVLNTSLEEITFHAIQIIHSNPIIILYLLNHVPFCFAIKYLLFFSAHYVTNCNNSDENSYDFANKKSFMHFPVA